MPKTKLVVASFGEHIRSLRVDQNLSLREVAFEIGVDTSLLGKIERNERQPTKDQIRALSSYFNINEKDLTKELLSDFFASKIVDEEVDVDTLKVAEKKVEYLKESRGKK